MLDGLSNGSSEVWISSNSDYTPAVTVWRTSWGDLVEADVIFFNGVKPISKLARFNCKEIPLYSDK